MEKIVKFHSQGDFLNKAYNHSDATIFSTVYARHYTNRRIFRPDMHVQLQLRDCRHTIEIALHYDCLEDYSNGLFKLNTMIKHLQKLKTAYTKSYIYYDKKMKEADAEAKKQAKLNKKKPMKRARSVSTPLLAELMNER